MDSNSNEDRCVAQSVDLIQSLQNLTWIARVHRSPFSVSVNSDSFSFPKMPLRLEIKRKLAQRSERVKSVDLHPTEPWILASLYSGTVCIWNYQSQFLNIPIPNLSENVIGAIYTYSMGLKALRVTVSSLDQVIIDALLFGGLF
ncbi:unnamed protein product [Camellia sinensis]